LHLFAGAGSHGWPHAGRDRRACESSPQSLPIAEAVGAIRLRSRVFDNLVALIERAGQTISKEELIARAWPGAVVEEGRPQLLF